MVACWVVQKESKLVVQMVASMVAQKVELMAAKTA